MVKMSAKFTPGPWEARKDAHGRGIIYAAGKWLATTWLANGDGNNAPYLPSEANARLIAAAPELLAASHAAKLALDDMQHAKDGRDWWVQRDTAMKQIDAAIAKVDAA